MNGSDGCGRMFTLSDSIEDYLKKLLSLSSRYYVDIRRYELSRKFFCAPSQINYVLSSRFSPERGYLVESRRGGKGYIRIYRLEPLQSRTWMEMVEQLTSADFNPVKAMQFLKRGSEEKIITQREARLLETMLKDDLYNGLPVMKAQVHALQSKLFKAAIAEVLKECY